MASVQKLTRTSDLSSPRNIKIKKHLENI